MARKMLIDAIHPEETRVVVADGTKVEEFDFESLNKRQLAGNIYLAKVTRVEPSLQAAFVEYGGNRHGFLSFSEIHPDYYQIPVADREALLAEERAYAEEQAAAEDDGARSNKPKRRRARRKKTAEVAAETAAGDAIATAEVGAASPGGMAVVDLEIPPPTDDPAGDSDRAHDAEDAATGHETADADPDPAGDAADSDVDDGTGTEAGGPGDGGDPAPDAETVADDDTRDDIRPARKQRPRKYKIQEVVKVRQIMLVQVVKEERGNKGAALTTYLSLAGRYCVLMPNTARGGGISRKITNAADRKKIKDIATALDVPQGAGLIVRTAGANRNRAEIKRDYEYLQRQWEQIRALTLESTAPAQIYEEGNLIHRSIRDLYNRDISEVLVEGEAGYRHAKDFMKMIMPSHARHVKPYGDPMPLFARHKVEDYLADMFNPTVRLRSGGYIVIGMTEALVAIDVNSGRATREGSIEETALKTNLEAAEEVARQVRLRDLAGLIVIDFIDMDDRRNNAMVEKRIKERLKSDRARIQVGRISAFGLMEMSRQRLRPGMLEATTRACGACRGTGLVRSDDSLALSILRQLEEEGTRRRARAVVLTAPVGIVNFLMNDKREYLAAIEARHGLSVRVEADPSMVPPEFKIEKSSTPARRAPAPAPVVSMDAALMDAVEDAAPDADDTVAEAVAGADDSGEQPRKKRRRRRGGRGRRKGGAETRDTTEAADDAPGEGSAGDAPESRAGTEETGAAASGMPEDANGDASDPAPARPRRRSRRRPASAPADAASAPEGTAPDAPAPTEAGVAAPAGVAPEPATAEADPVGPAPASEPDPGRDTRSDPAPEAAAPADAPAEAAAPRPRKRGWWSLG